MQIVACGAPAPDVVYPAERNSPAGEVDALALWDDNGDGRITCAEARRHGIAPVPRGHPAYRYMRDGDGDGIVCE
ncbi:MAG: excalibur calcium-binding domain-containing protein [Gammaproteobacteria bacterium]|nr:excalibur calcium-binding domain-containing protein [Gammaproteobacteria bacterium]